jgi:SAM-dependent methyltransferase
MSPPQLSRPAALLVAAVHPDTAVLDLYSERGSEVYAEMTVGDDAEVREILDAARHTHGSILELACGAGRLTLPLARLGRRVVAVDNSPRMLELLVELTEAAGLEAVMPHQGDMSTFELGEKFGLIVLATTSITLLSAEQRQILLTRVHRQLAPDGLFVVSVHATAVAPGKGEMLAVPLLTAQHDLVLLSEEVDVEGGHRDVSVIRLHRTQDKCHVEAFSSRVHLLDVDGLVRELHDAGFTVRGVHPVRFSDGPRAVSLIECSR